MTANDRFDQRLADALAGLADPRVPDYIGDVLALTGQQPQRPSWTFAARWLPLAPAARPSAKGRPLRPAWQLSIQGLSATLVLAGGITVGSALLRTADTDLPPPVGPAANGLVAYASGGDIFMGDPLTGATQAIVTGPDTETEPRFSPDGTRIAFLRYPGGLPDDPGAPWPSADLVVAWADGSDAKVITPSGFLTSEHRTFEWTLDGGSLIVGRYDYPQAPLPSELVQLEATGEGEPRVLTSPPSAYPAGLTMLVSSTGVRSARLMTLDDHRGGWSILAPTGDRVLTYAGRGVLSVADADGTDPAVLIPNAWMMDMGYAGLRDPAWSPDGSRAVFLAGGRQHLYVVDADSDDVRRIGLEAWGPLQWSPDGTRIASVRWLGCDPKHPCFGGDPQIVITDVASGLEAYAGDPTSDLVGWSWSPDGRSILVQERAGGRPLVMDLGSGVATELPWEADSLPSWQRVTPG
jgi:Tol biopolymer transport system component